MSKREKLSLDVDTPDEVADVLYAAAQSYYEDASELSYYHGDPMAGVVWEQIAHELERSARRIDNIVRDYGYEV